MLSRKEAELFQDTEMDDIAADDLASATMAAANFAEILMSDGVQHGVVLAGMARAAALIIGFNLPAEEIDAMIDQMAHLMKISAHKAAEVKSAAPTVN